MSKARHAAMNARQVSTPSDRDFPVHFFTIVLNGQPFIRYHINVMRHLPFRWHWHIIEGVAELTHDTAWSVANGGEITRTFHRNGLSLDGTSEYLDQLSSLFPQNITLYRPEPGRFWDGKRAMVSAPLAHIHEECLLWQIDVDEFWTPEQFCAARNLFRHHPDKTAAIYACNFYVGPNLIISDRYSATGNLRDTWLRSWRYTPGCTWKAHEPPMLHCPTADGASCDVAGINPFWHTETKEAGLVFQHYAYVLPQQIRFKEKYYGYKNAYFLWLQLQKETRFPLRLKEFFPWPFVDDGDMVCPPLHEGIMPIPLPARVVDPRAKRCIVLDGTIFRQGKSHTSRVWHLILAAWSRTPLADSIVIIDRDGTSPLLPGYRYRRIEAYAPGQVIGDAVLFQEICSREGADLFLATTPCRPTHTPTLSLVTDLSAEILHENSADPSGAICQSDGAPGNYFCASSVFLARELAERHPDTGARGLPVVHLAADDAFTPCPPHEQGHFQERYRITKPYYLCASPWVWHSSLQTLLRVFAALPNRQQYQLVWVGADSVPDGFHADNVVTIRELTANDMAAAYAGAVAFVHLPLCDGTGERVLEAMACGCPVIAANTGALPEMAGTAAHLVCPASRDEIYRALLAVQVDAERMRLKARSLERAEAFSWARTADELAYVVAGAAGLTQGLDEITVTQSNDC